jgi:hypothetical protein
MPRNESVRAVFRHPYLFASIPSPDEAKDIADVRISIWKSSNYKHAADEQSTLLRAS